LQKLVLNSYQTIRTDHQLLKSIRVSIPEVGQIKDIVHDSNLKPLIDELDRSKKTRKKGLKSFDYYKVEVVFEIEGEISGFIPNQDGILMHYRDLEGNLIFRQYHFRNWLRDNLPLINRSSSSIGDMRFFDGRVISKSKPIIDERYVTNIDSGFSSSRGTGGRGTRRAEILARDSKVITCFSFPRELINPEKIQKAFDVICQNGNSFGGNHKLSTGRLVNPKVNILTESLWEDED
jgi:hypothetical protein